MSKYAMYALDSIAGFEITALHVYEIQLKRLYCDRSIFSELLIAYSEKDADTLAVFITVYNAVYRSKLDTLKSKYKNAFERKTIFHD